jgi:hypothetical protein
LEHKKARHAGGLLRRRRHAMIIFELILLLVVTLTLIYVLARTIETYHEKRR